MKKLLSTQTFRLIIVIIKSKHILEEWKWKSDPLNELDLGLQTPYWYNTLLHISGLASKLSVPYCLCEVMIKT